MGKSLMSCFFGLTVYMTLDWSVGRAAAAA